MEVKKHIFPYEWKLSETIFTKDAGTVFSCFACGGGSTMGYKLAGFDVLGANEIDPKMAECYIENHKPKYIFVEPIQDFKNRQNIPEELFDLDILDGSPPCSSFSMAGNREKDWGKEKNFRGGQSKQVLDTLFFDFIDLAKRLQPKVVIAENVKGIILGDAKKYSQKIIQEFEKAGYSVEYYLLDASKMGVPQKRERVFFIGLRNDLCDKVPGKRVNMFSSFPFLDLEFKEKEIKFKQVFKDYKDRELSKGYKLLWDNRKKGDIDLSYSNARLGKNPNAHFNNNYLYMDKVANTITANDNCVLFDQDRFRNFDELCECGTYPKDYNFLENKPEYLIGMSVPPVMIAQIAKRIKENWLDKIKQLIINNKK